MKPNSTFKLLLTFIVFVSSLSIIKAQTFIENFDLYSSLAGRGWVMQNNSNPLGGTNWYQGVSVAAGGPFNSFNGPDSSYIAANYNSTGGSIFSSGKISNWLISPVFNLRNGDTVKFYTQTDPANFSPDRLQFRLSTNGASVNVGTTANSVGDFTTLLQDINPTLALSVYPLVWTQFTSIISGLSAPTSGRVAFRYFVTNAGYYGSNSDYIGIDNFVYSPYICHSLSISPTTITNAQLGVAFNQSLSQTGALGTATYTLSSGTLPTGLSFSSTGIISGTPTVSGTYNFNVTVSDASACTGTQSFSIIIGCPSGVAAISAINPLCANSAPLTLLGGSPAGGTYSGTGVNAGVFDPSMGSQTVTYTYVSGTCVNTATTLITVNPLPVVTANASSSSVCSGSMVTLTGGGASTYVWDNGVTDGVAVPVTAPTNYNVTGTDANGCTNTASTSVSLISAPVAPAAILGVDTICGLSSAVYYVSAVSGASSYSWTIPSGWSGTSTTDSITASSISSIGTISVTANNTCGSSASQSLNVFFGNPPAQPSSILGVTHLCDSSSTAYAVTLDPSATGYTWTLPSGWSGSSSNYTITATASTSNGVITVTADNACGSSTPSTLTVFASTIPTVTVAPFAMACSSWSAFALSGGNPSGGTYSGIGVNSNLFDPSLSGTGTFMITYTYANGACVRSDSSAITVDLCLGINSNSDNDEMSIYPNPAANGMFTIHIKFDSKELLTSIIDVQGREIYSSSDKKNSTDYIKQINLEGVSKGIYFVKLNTGTQVQMSKLIIE